MYTLNQISDTAQRINLWMLSKGKPIDKDDYGYNRPDYVAMAGYGMRFGLVNPNASDLHDILETLLHYKNTQLCDDREMLEEMLGDLEKQNPTARETKSVPVKSISSKHMVTDGKGTPAVVRMTDQGELVIMKLPCDARVNDLVHSLQDEGRRIGNRNLGDGWHVVIGRDAVDEFTEGLPKLGYTESFASDIRKFAEDHPFEQKTGKSVTVKSYDPIARYFYVSFDKDITMTNWIKTSEWCSWLKEKGVWSLKIDEDGISEVLNQFRMRDFDTSEIDTILSHKKMEKFYAPKQLPVEPFKPYLFQLQDVEEMLKKKTEIQASEMGSGKTNICVRVGYSLEDMQKLIICPPSLRLNWKHEILMCEPNADIGILYSDTKEKDLHAHEWTIVGYSSLKKLLPSLLSMHFNCIFADEAHYIKAVNSWGQPKSDRGKAALALANQAEYVYAITGTPKTSRNLDLYNLLQFIRHPMLRHMRFIDYAIEYCDARQERFGWDMKGNSNDMELNRELAPYMIRHLKKDVLPHLKKQRQSIPVDSNISEYVRIMTEAKKQIEKNRKEKGGDGLDGTVIAMFTKARQSLAISKIKETMDFADTILNSGEDDRIVIVTCFTEVIEKLEEKYKEKSCKVVGGMSDEEKQQAVDDFQTGKKQVMLLNLQAGGVGITLDSGHTEIINDVSWVPGDMVQVEDRICRGSQKNVCMIYYMTSLGVNMETKLLETLSDKSKTISRAVDGGSSETVDYVKMALDGKF